MDNYIICIHYLNSENIEWYCGGNYQFNNEKYPVVGSKENAKRFKSEKLAQRSVESIIGLNNPYVKECEIVKE